MSETCSVRTADLREAVALCGMAAKSRTTIDALKCIHFAASGDSLEVRATDLELSVGAEIACDGTPVSGGVDADRLSAAVREMGGETTQIHRDGSKLKLSDGGRSITLPIADHEIPPKPEAPADVTPCAVDGDALAEGIKCAMFCVESVETKYTGFRVEPVASGLLMAGSNGRQMSAIRINAVASPSPAKKVPQKFLSSLCRCAAGGDASVWVGDRTIHVAAGGRWVSAPLSEHPAYPVEGIIPSSVDVTASFNREALLSDLRAASVVMGGDGVNAAVTLSVQGGKYVIAGNAERGSAFARGDCVCDRGFAIVVNCTYLTSAIATAPGETVTIGYNSRTRPIGIDLDTDHRQVVAPLNFEPIPAALAA